MQPRRTEILSPDPVGIARAAAILLAGGLVALPTETVYGLAADATDPAAVAAIYAAKGRPAHNPLIVHLPDLQAARRFARFDPVAERLAAAFWPGPLTLVLPLRPGSGLAPAVTAGHDRVAIRVPAHPVAQALLRAAGRPLAAPSANPSGRVSPTTAAHVLDGLSGRIDAVIDAGPCAVGIESTILATAPDLHLLRPGGIAAEAISVVAGQAPRAGPDAARPVAPGQLASHYAPAARLRLNATEVRAGEVGIGFGAGLAGAALTLSASGDLGEAAARLFDLLRLADRLAGPDGAIAVARVPETGLGAAINDRLRRAAAPRA